MSSLSFQRVMKNGIISISFQGIPILAALLCIPIAIKSLGTDVWGLYSLGVSLLVLFNYLNFGVNPSVNRRLSSEIPTRNEGVIQVILSSGFYINLLIAGFVALIIIVGSPVFVGFVVKEKELQDLAGTLFKIMGISGGVSLVIGFFRNVFEANQSFYVVSILRATLSSVLLIAPAATLWFEWDVVMAARSVMITYCLVLIVYLVLYYREYSFPKISSVKKAEVKGLFSFGVWVSAYSALNPIFLYFDRFLIANLLGIQLVAFYTTPYDLISRMSLISGSLTAAFFPAVSRWIAEKQFKQLSEALYRTYLFLSIIMFGTSVIIIVFGDFLLGFWLGEEFSQKSVQLLRVLTVGVFCNGLSIVGLRFLYGLGDSKRPFYVLLLEVPVYLIILFVFTDRFGINGTALAFGLRTLLDAGCLYIMSNNSLSKLSVSGSLPSKLSISMVVQVLVLVSLVILM